MISNETTITTDINVFGTQVETFPNGIDKAFDVLVVKVPGGFSRSFYGIAGSNADGHFKYYATAEETKPGEGARLGYERHKIQKGKYLSVLLSDWRTKTSTINEIFQQLMQEPNVDLTAPCIEWYENEKRMHCMVRLRTTNNL